MKYQFLYQDERKEYHGLDTCDEKIIEANTFYEALKLFKAWLESTYNLRDVGGIDPEAKDENGVLYDVPEDYRDYVDGFVWDNPGFAPPDYAPSLDHTG